MSRLNDRAYQLISEELNRIVGQDAVAKVQQEILLRRLGKLRAQTGSPATRAELEDVIVDLFPTFSHDVLRKAAKANSQGTSRRSQQGRSQELQRIALLLLIFTGGLFVVNLPYPFIRRPVANAAPFLLLPSYIGMDYHYRQAVSLVSQADQLVNSPTSAADLDLGSTKVTQAKSHLDHLPVWFMEPGSYRPFWIYRMTIDDFRAARENVGRMEARLFQEQNAQTSLTKAEQSLTQAKQQYEQATTNQDKGAAIANWQVALDQVSLIPEATLAGRTAQAKLSAYRRDFDQVATMNRGGNVTQTLMAAAQQFATIAAQSADNPPHSAEQWEQIAGFWSEAIAKLEGIAVSEPNYLEAQKLLATYKKNLSTAKLNQSTEAKSAQALAMAKSNIADLQSLGGSTDNRSQIISGLQRIIDQLVLVQPNTTGYAEAQQLLEFARKKQQQVSR